MQLQQPGQCRVRTDRLSRRTTFHPTDLDPQFGEWIEGKGGADGHSDMVEHVFEHVKIVVRITSSAGNICRLFTFYSLEREGAP